MLSRTRIEGGALSAGGEREEASEGEAGDAVDVGVGPLRRHLHLQQPTRSGPKGFHARGAEANHNSW